MTLYAAALLYLLTILNLWATHLVAETVFWFLFSGLVILYRGITRGAEADFFKKTVLSVFAIATLSEFVFNLRPLGLVSELVLVAGLFFLFTTITVAEATNQDRHTVGFLRGFLAAVIVFLLVYTVAGMVSEPEIFLTYANLLEFLLPFLLTVGVLPYVYGVALSSTYGLLFMRLNWKLDDKAARRYAKWRALRAVNVRLSRTHRLASKFAWRLAPGADKGEIDRALVRSLETE